MRKLHPSLKTKLDELLLPVVGPPRIDTKNPNLNLWLLAAASACVGIKESGGENKGEMVELFQKTIGDSYQEPWCAAFIQSMIAYVEVLSGVRSKIFASESCLEIWHNSRSCMVEGQPQLGDLVVWQKLDSPQGHIGIVIDVPSPKNIQSIEGNTGNAVGIVREGDGVFVRSRQRGGMGLMRELGFLRPFPNIQNVVSKH